MHKQGRVWSTVTESPSVVALAKRQRVGNGWGGALGPREPVGMMAILRTMNRVVISWVYTFFQPHQTVHFVCVPFIVYKLYLNKVHFKKSMMQEDQFQKVSREHILAETRVNPWKCWELVPDTWWSVGRWFKDLQSCANTCGWLTRQTLWATVHRNSVSKLGKNAIRRFEHIQIKKKKREREMNRAALQWQDT